MQNSSPPVDVPGLLLALQLDVLEMFENVRDYDAEAGQIVCDNTHKEGLRKEKESLKECTENCPKTQNSALKERPDNRGMA